MADAAVVTKDPDAMTEAVRGALGRAICRQYQTDAASWWRSTWRRALEERLMASIVRTEQGAVLALEPAQRAETWRRGSRARSSRPWHSLCSCARRRCVRICGGCSPACCRTSGVLSHGEVPTHVRIAPVAVLD